MSRSKSLVQAVELWFPQGEVMAFAAGAYRGNDELRLERERMSFHQGEGLPGSVWAKGKAFLMETSNSEFVSAELAEQAGIDAVVGCPLFEGGRLFAVLTLMLSHRSEAPSCLEIWDVADELDVLKHSQGYYVHCADLERFSPWIQFPRGTGLPGLTWLSGDAQVMADVCKSNAFIRAGLAARAGLKPGVGIPLYRERRVMQVLALIGAEQQPFVSGVEIYHPQGRELGAATLFDWSGRGSTTGESFADAAGRQLAQQALATRLPALSQTRVGAGYEIWLALPLYDRKGLKQILVLRLA
jgi:hypothetical protein